MSKIFKNERFRVAVDYLRNKNVVKTDKELATKIGVTAAALSRIRKDLTTISDDTLYKMNDAFDGIFNMAYFRGESEHMLVEDVVDAKQKAASPSTNEPTANILEIYAQMIRGLDDLRQQLKDELAEVQQLKQEYLTARDDLHKAIAALHPSIKYVSPSDQPRMAAEDTQNK
jgi:transcriptional regulator with XRE-family HTH domain